jgi:hypothetical protein
METIGVIYWYNIYDGIETFLKILLNTNPRTLERDGLSTMDECGGMFPSVEVYGVPPMLATILLKR